MRLTSRYQNVFHLDVGDRWSDTLLVSLLVGEDDEAEDFNAKRVATRAWRGEKKRWRAKPNLLGGVPDSRLAPVLKRATLSRKSCRRRWVGWMMLMLSGASMSRVRLKENMRQQLRSAAFERKLARGERMEVQGGEYPTPSHQ